MLLVSNKLSSAGGERFSVANGDAEKFIHHREKVKIVQGGVVVPFELHQYPGRACGSISK